MAKESGKENIMGDMNGNGEEKPQEQEGIEQPSLPDDQDFESSAAHQPKQITITDVELRQLKRELMDYKDKYLRLLADVENTRKRMQKERQELTKQALENVIVEFLYPLDNLENALKFAQHMSDEVKHWAVGFQMILTQFKDVLTNNGVTPIESVGKPFDPHKHEAVEMISSSNYPPGIIVEEPVRGYCIGDRTIRPARVKVAKSSEDKVGPSGDKTEETKNEQSKNKN